MLSFVSQDKWLNSFKRALTLLPNHVHRAAGGFTNQRMKSSLSLNIGALVV